MTAWPGHDGLDPAGAARPSTSEGPGHGPTRRWRRVRRRLWILVGVVSVALVVVTALARPDVVARPALTVKGGGPAKAFALENLRQGGPTVSLAQYRGRPVVVNFFASWCVPCRREMPGFEAVYEKVGDRVAFVGVNHQDNREGALELLSDTGVRYPSGFDPDGKVAASYGLFGMPTTLFISDQGAVLERRTGEISEKELLAIIERLFPT